MGEVKRGYRPFARSSSINQASGNNSGVIFLPESGSPACCGRPIDDGPLAILRKPLHNADCGIEQA
ncbi:MAG: hypothetical protein OXP09_07300 [Gammaproteobacteria bacterium]|nr:hypothetical protein [Gammaproteobacteria bacterium]MDE0365367.1 hypothetical protein [Gammaproteobacteria bacterium]